MFIIKDVSISTGKKNSTKSVNIWIDGGKITKIGKGTILPSAVVINAKGLIAIPGGIDPHVHFDTPGFENREDFAHGTKAAAAGGITTIIDMPCTSIPPVTSASSLQNKLNIVTPQAFVDFALWGGLSQNAVRDQDWFTNMDELWSLGVIGFKVYMISGMETFKALSFIEIGQVMQRAHDMGALIGLHAEDEKLIHERMATLKGANKNTLDDYYISRSDPAEKDGVALGVGLARQTKVRLHIVHLGSASAAQLISWAKQMKLDISAETCPHYLTFTHDDFAKYGSIIKTAPVIKEASDRAGLWQHLIDGTIDFLSTDHAPCQPLEKNTGNAWTDYGGMPSVQLLLPFAFSEGYKKDRLTLARFVEVTSSSAAKRFGLYPKKGALTIGSDADIVLIDSDKKWVVRSEDMQSKAKWTPFEGREFTGKIIYTILRGEIVYSEDKGVVGAPSGKWIKRIS